MESHPLRFALRAWLRAFCAHAWCLFVAVGDDKLCDVLKHRVSPGDVLGDVVSECEPWVEDPCSANSAYLARQVDMELASVALDQHTRHDGLCANLVGLAPLLPSA